MDPSMESASNAEDAGIGVVAMKVMAGGSRADARQPGQQQTGDILHREGAMLAAIEVGAAQHERPHHDSEHHRYRSARRESEGHGRADLARREEAARTAIWRARPYCNMCGECAGTCAKGLPVADVLRFYMYSENYGQFGLGLENFRQLPAHLQAVRCGDCGECTVRCPNGVRIVERLARAQEMFA